MYGSGLFKGLGVSFKHCFRREFTEQYPEQRPNLPPASQGFFKYIPEKCIACSLCERACPNHVISVGVGKNEEGKRVVESYDMDISYCLYCGLCIEACPTQALLNANNFELACYHRDHSQYAFMGDIPQAMNDAFDAKQAEYWEKHANEKTKVSMPKAVPAAGAKPPVEKPAEKPAETKADDAAKGATE